MPGITFNPFFPLKICSCAANQHPAVIQDYYFPVTALIPGTTVLDIKRTVAEHFANYLIHIFMDNIYMHDYHITCTITQDTTSLTSSIPHKSPHFFTGCCLLLGKRFPVFLIPQYSFFLFLQKDSFLKINIQ